MDVLLTPHQEEKMDTIISMLNDGMRRVVLTGSAGVGKTTLVNFILSKYKHNGLIYVTAPTHKAVSVLRDKIDNDDENILFSTLHKALKLKLAVNRINGNKEFKQVYPKNSPPFYKCRMLVIDEASMLNTKMLDYLTQYQFPIIFIGDEKQINPVKEEYSPVFHQNWPSVKLTEIIRQAADNPVIGLSRNMGLIKDVKADLVIGDDAIKRGYLFTGDREKIIHKLADVNGTDDLKYLAWTNEEVDSVNYSVRNLLYGDAPNLIEEGEVLVLNGHYSAGNKILTNNSQLEVENIEVENTKVFVDKYPMEFKCYVINGDILALHESSIKDYKNALYRLKARAINRDITWPEYYDFQDRFLDFKYNHALTVHKSQGSTYKDVIVNVRDIKSNWKKNEQTRLLYTAITRCEELLILYNV